MKPVRLRKNYPETEFFPVITICIFLYLEAATEGVL